MALLSSLMQKHFHFKQRLNRVKRPAAAAGAAGAEAPDFRLGGLIRPDPARHFYSTLSLLLLHTSQPNTSDAASLYKPPIRNGVESRYEVAFEFHLFIINGCFMKIRTTHKSIFIIIYRIEIKH